MQRVRNSVNVKLRLSLMVTLGSGVKVSFRIDFSISVISSSVRKRYLGLITFCE